MGPLAGRLSPRWETDIETPFRESFGIKFIYWVMEGKGRREEGKRRERGRNCLSRRRADSGAGVTGEEVGDPLVSAKVEVESGSVQGLSLKGTGHPGQHIYFSNRGHDGLPFQRAQLASSSTKVTKRT